MFQVLVTVTSDKEQKCIPQQNQTILECEDKLFLQGLREVPVNTYGTLDVLFINHGCPIVSRDK
jgi:hypothetical protein